MQTSRKNLLIGSALIVLGLFLLVWFTLVSSPHAVPIMMGAIVMLIGVMVIKGFWQQAPAKHSQGRHAPVKGGKRHLKAKRSKRRHK